MRLFVSINFNGQTLSELVGITDKLRAYSQSGNFSRKENLHLTLAFLGELSMRECTSAEQAMSKLFFRPFTIAFEGFGSFGRDREKLYWVGLKKNSELRMLHSSLVKKLSDNGIFTDSKPFCPHITIGRQVLMPGDFSEASFGEQLSVTSADVEKISLMLSERVGGKLTYTEIFAVSSS